MLVSRLDRQAVSENKFFSFSTTSKLQFLLVPTGKPSDLLVVEIFNQNGLIRSKQPSFHLLPLIKFRVRNGLEPIPGRDA